MQFKRARASQNQAYSEGWLFNLFDFEIGLDWNLIEVFVVVDYVFMLAGFDDWIFALWLCRWVEFANKFVAKRVANNLNGEQIGTCLTLELFYSLKLVKQKIKFVHNSVSESYCVY